MFVFLVSVHLRMNLSIPPLIAGDKIAIVAPAKSIEQHLVLEAKDILENSGYEVVLGPHVFGVHHYYSGTVEERLIDFQSALDDPTIKAVLCARGGYGCIHIVDLINWSSLIRQPKWVIGFSDVTVFHQHIQRLGIQSVHGTMPLNFCDNSKESFSTLWEALAHKEYVIKTTAHPENKLGIATGRLVGGNLSILYSLLGTDDQIDYTDTILFVEEVGEQLYAIDRMLHSFKKAGVLDKIKGLIVGGMTDLKDTAVPIGTSLEEIVLHHFQYMKTPVCFGFPAGHVNDNRALRLGAQASLNITAEESTLTVYGD